MQHLRVNADDERPHEWNSKENILHTKLLELHKLKHIRGRRRRRNGKKFPSRSLYANFRSTPGVNRFYATNIFANL